MAVVLAGFSEEQSGSIQEFITGLVDARMEIAGRAALFINDLDQKQRATIEQVNTEMGRMNERVSEMNTIKEGIELTYKNLQELNTGTTAFAETTRAELASGAAANDLAQQKANEVNAKVTELFTKTELTFAETEKKSLALREEIRVWSYGFATRVEEMCRTGNFKFDARPPVAVAKHDKKEVSVWKLVTESPSRTSATGSAASISSWRPSTDSCTPTWSSESSRG